VDPESLKRKSPDVSGRLPLIMKELKTIPDNTILDAEFIAVKGDEILHRTTANSLLNATKFSPDKLADFAHVFVFDILAFNGEDIRNQPLHERVEYLQRIESTEHIWIEAHTTDINKPNYPAYIVDGNDIKAINKVIDNLLNIEEMVIN
jgi:ATP-dependent DNA ligase